MLKRCIHICSAVFILTLCCQCIDAIRLDIDNVQQRLAIEGLIADSLDTYYVRVHYSPIIGVGNDNILEPVSDAKVKVIDNLGGSFDFLEMEPGVYAKKMQGEIGKAYHVEIELPDGKVIQSEPETINQAPPIGHITTQVKDETFINSSGNVAVDRRLIVKVNTSIQDLETRPFLRWRAEGEFEFKEQYPGALSTKTCYIPNNIDLNNLKIFDTNTLAGDEIIEEPFINTDLDYRFAIQYCLHVKQYALSEKEFQYWESVQDIINIDGSIFDPPPGTVKGNLFNTEDPDEQIVGYFSANGVKSLRFWANPQSLDQINIDTKCRLRFGATPTQDCIDCLTIKFSTTERPPYWEP